MTNPSSFTYLLYNNSPVHLNMFSQKSRRYLFLIVQNKVHRHFGEVPRKLKVKLRKNPGFLPIAT